MKEMAARLQPVAALICKSDDRLTDVRPCKTRQVGGREREHGRGEGTFERTARGAAFSVQSQDGKSAFDEKTSHGVCFDESCIAEKCRCLISAPAQKSVSYNGICHESKTTCKSMSMSMCQYVLRTTGNTPECARCASTERTKKIPQAEA